MDAVEEHKELAVSVKQLYAEIQAQRAQINELTSQGKGERLDVTVDSGAAVSALPLDKAPGVTLQAIPNPREYTAASGHAVHEHGIKVPSVEFLDGSVGQIKFHVLDVNKPLLAVSAAVNNKGAKGVNQHRVVYQPDAYGGCYIESLDKNSQPMKPKGRAKKIFERNGTYKMPVWVTNKKSSGRLAAVCAEGAGGKPSGKAPDAYPNQRQGGHP